MKIKHYLTSIVMLLACGSAMAQANVYSPVRAFDQPKSFAKGTWLVSVSGGSTNADYITETAKEPRKKCDLDGIRDPLIVEYGVTNRIGIGFSSGADIFQVDPMYYGQSASKPFEVYTKEFTADINYHFLVTQRLDFSAFGSYGCFGTTFYHEENGTKYSYESKGAIGRVGIKGKLYIFPRFHILGMVSAYSANSTGQGAIVAESPASYNTKLRGTAIEFGLGFRLGRRLDW